MKHFVRHTCWIGLILMLVIQAAPGFSQTALSDLKKRDQKSFREAKELVLFERFGEAVDLLSRILSSYPDFREGAFLKAEALYRSGRFREAAASMEEAILMKTKPDASDLFTLARIYQDIPEPEEAIRVYHAFLEAGSGNDRKMQLAREAIDELKLLQRGMDHPVPFAPEKLGAAINTDKYAEYWPSFSADGKVMIFTRGANGQEDFYISESGPGGEWQPAYPVNALNTPLNEGAHTVSADGELIVFTGCNRRDGLGSCDLYFVVKREGEWSPAVNFGPGINTPGWEGQPTISADGRKLFFVSNRPGGIGGKDIWMTMRLPGGDWSTPVNLGKTINTPGDEQSPFLHLDGVHLYFNSDGHPGFGGGDIYVAEFDLGRWQDPAHLGYPINTREEEGALSVSPDGRYAYFARGEKAGVDLSGYTNHDIYRFLLPDEFRPARIAMVEIVVIDKVSQKPVPAEIELFVPGDAESRSSFSFEPGETSELVVMHANRTYGIHVSAGQYAFYSGQLALPGGGDSFLRDTIALEPLSPPAAETSSPVILRNIFFETGSAKLEGRSDFELGRLVSLLEEEEDLNIEIRGHTDNVGSPEDNLELSTQRARAVYDYLVQAGITQERLSYLGFGETLPIAANDTEEGRQQNRRTEFVILQ